MELQLQMLTSVRETQRPRIMLASRNIPNHFFLMKLGKGAFPVGHLGDKKTHILAKSSWNT